jgi:hypothetical protein
VLPWEWAEERLAAAVKYWVTTVRPDGAPNSRPVWAVWLPDGLWFSTGGAIRHHLERNPQVSVTVAGPADNVIVEGTATRVRSAADLEPMCRAYGPKYDHPIHPEDDGVSDGGEAKGPAYLVRPRVVFGWDDELRAPTRWEFPPIASRA